MTLERRVNDPDIRHVGIGKDDAAVDGGLVAGLEATLLGDTVDAAVHRVDSLFDRRRVGDGEAAPNIGREGRNTDTGGDETLLGVRTDTSWVDREAGQVTDVLGVLRNGLEDQGGNAGNLGHLQVVVHICT